MRFDSTLYYHVGDGSYKWETLIDEYRETVKLLEEGGFEAVWLAEHHFHWDGWYRAPPNPILLGADLAAHTTKLRLGQCGTIIPDWHPIRLAEDLAMLDQLSKGRAELGIGRGIPSRSSLQFNIYADRSNRERNYALFAEVLDIVMKAWTEDVLVHKGEFFTFPEPGYFEASNLSRGDRRFHNEDGELIGLGIEPRPVQKPHPPIYQMADSVRSHAFAGSKGINAMAISPSHAKLNESWLAYQEARSKKEGLEFPYAEGVSVMRPTFVADTTEEAIEYARWGAHQLARWQGGNPAKMRQAILTDEELANDDPSMDIFDFQYKHDMVLVGSPEYVTEQIERLRAETKCNHLALFLNFPGIPFEKVRHGLELFAEKVIPNFN